MATGKILVTGAAGGQQGRTGRLISEMLLARGTPVRALVRTLDERADQLRALGAEVVQGDLLDLQSILRAVKGVSTVYFAYPVQEGLIDATANMAAAARHAGVSRLIDMVMLESSLDAPTPRLQQNYLSEQIFEWAGIGVAHVRATVFYENVRALAGWSLASNGTILLPWGKENTEFPLVSGEDVARVAVGLLTAPSVPPGSSYRVIGEVLSVGDLVATFRRALGRDVRYQEITDKLWHDGALGRGVNPHAVDHLSHLWQAFRTTDRKFQATDTIEKWGGQKAKTFEAFVLEHKAEFSAKAA